MPRMRPTSRERSSAATNARPISPVGPVTATVRSFLELARGAIHALYRIAGIAGIAAIVAIVAIAAIAAIAAPLASIARFRRMSGTELGLSISVFLASAVESVEALTIVMAVGYTRSWPSALSGVAAAAAALAAIVLGLGAALISLPIDDLRVAIGVLLLLVGLQWLRKAVLRAAGLKALHDERGSYEHELAAARAAGRAAGAWDGYSFAIACKGVLIEGLEVAVIVVTLGADQHHTALAAAAAAAAVAVVVAAGIAARAPLARVPENAMKLAVGVMLSSFGIFWVAEGAGVRWPGGDAMLLAIVCLTFAAAMVAVQSLRTGAAR